MLYRIIITSFRIYTDDPENPVYNIEKQIDYLIGNALHKKEVTVAETETIEEAVKIFEAEKQKIQKVAYNLQEEYYEGQKIEIYQVEEDGLFKGLTYPDPEREYINL